MYDKSRLESCHVNESFVKIVYEPCPEAIVAETVEAFGEDCVLSLDFAGRTGEGLLVFSHFLLQDLVHVGVSGHLDFPQPLHLAFDQAQLLLEPLRLERLTLQRRRFLRHRLLNLLDLKNQHKHGIYHRNQQNARQLIRWLIRASSD